MTTREIYRGDCLNVLQDHIEPESVDLVYLDPPFNSNANYNLPFKKSRSKDYEAVEAFVDTWTWTADDDTWLTEFKRMREPYTTLAMIVETAQRIEQIGGGVRRKTKNSLASYLLNMALRLIAIRDVMKPTASIYLHCDWYAGHYLKIVMDAIFGREKFKNEVAWGYRTQGIAMRWWPRKHDTLFFYSKGDSWVFYSHKERQIYQKPFRHTKVNEMGEYYVDTYIRDIWDNDSTKPPISQSPENLGYPTQKPLAV